MSALHDPRVRDLPLVELALGLRSAVDRFDALLARFAPAGAPRTARDEEPSPGDESWPLIVLGAIALRDRIAGALAACEPPPDVAETAAGAELGDLLR